MLRLEESNADSANNLREMGKLRLLLRFDDICSTMDWTQWKKAKNLLDKNNLTALLGVIPDCKDPDLLIDNTRSDFWEYIRELQQSGYTIAMHGLYHVFDTEAKGIVTKCKRSEFAGHPYEVQYEKIKKGKEALLAHGIDTDVFFAPAHSYDDNTLKALAANGFRYVSDGMSAKPYTRHGIICIPCRNAGIPKIRKSQAYTVVLHAHEWVREDKRRAWDDLQKLISKHHDAIESFEEYKKQTEGTPLLERNNERIYFYWSSYVKPILSKVKRSILK